VSNLINMMPSAVYDWLVFADSDVQVPANYLRHVIGELQKPGVGLVTCLYRGRAAPGFWPRLSSQWVTYSFLPSVITGVSLKIAQPCFGQTIAMRRATLDRIGGLGRFGHLLVEDDAIGKAVRSAGEAIAIPPIVIGHTCDERDAATVTMHELRWSVAMRRTDPFYHLGTAITQPLPLALIAYALSGGARWSWLLVASALAARVLLKLRTDAALHESERCVWLLPVRDIYSFLILTASYFTSRVVWRGHWFDIGYGGILRPGADEDA
jgi:ceramide glucosyltransferase